MQNTRRHLDQAAEAAIAPPKQAQAQAQEQCLRAQPDCGPSVTRCHAPYDLSEPLTIDRED